MNSTIKIVSLGALALFYACAQEAQPTETKPGDVTPKSLVTRPTPPQLPSQELIRVASPSSPRDAIALPPAPLQSSHRDTNLRIAAGSSPGSYAVRVDAPEGGTISLSGSSQPDDAVLADVKVLAPDGTVLNERAPKPPSADGSPLPATRPMSVVDLTGHPAGAYTIVTGSVAAQGGFAVFAAQPNATLVMQLQPSVVHFLLGDDATVEARLMDGDTPVSGAVLEGQLFAPDDSAQALKFVDMGGGKYRAWISPSLGATDQTGTYNVTVHATGITASGTAFARDGITALSYAIATARINEVSATRTVFDAAGNVSNLEADVTVEAVSTDRYEVSATLGATAPDGTERAVGTAQTAAVLPAGIHTVTLSFDAGYAKLTGLEGKYTVRNLTLYSQGRASMLHRSYDGLGAAFKPVRLSQLADLVVVPPAVEEMQEEGLFKLQ